MGKKGGFPGGMGMGNMNNLLKQAQRMQKQMEEQQKELEAFRAGLKKGDKVVTTGGIFGIVDEVTDKTVLIKVDGDVKLRMDKNSIIRDYTAQ